MFNILVDFKLTKKIKIDKLGLTFRNLTTKEKKMVLEQVDNIYTKNKKLINDCIKKYSSEDELKLSIDLLKYDDKVRQIVMFCFLGIKSGFSFNTPKVINQVLDKIIIIDIKKIFFLNILTKKILLKLFLIF